MRRFIFSTFTLCLLAIMIACQDETSSSDGYGYLQVSSVGLDKNVIPQARAVEKMGLDILQEGTVVKHVDDWTLLQSESLLLPVGNYFLRAYSMDKDSTQQGFEVAPYYLGETLVKIEKDISRSVEIVCSMVQSMVAVSYSQNFKNAFSSYDCVVSNEYGSIDFTSQETRPAYCRTGKSLNAVLKVTNTDGNSFTFNKVITEKAEKRYYYKVKYDVTNEGNGSFNFTVDETTHEYEVNITVPMTSDADPNLKVTGSNAFGKFAYMYGASTLTGETEPIVFQYKKSSEGVWKSVSTTVENGVYSAKTEELEFGTSYVYRLACGTKVGATDMFTTEVYQEIPNLNFDTWSQSGKNYFANADASDSYWATGNTGVTSILAGSKDPITVSVEGDDAYSGKAAKLRTITGVTLVKSAAGNLFIGSYKTNMSNPSASVTFGRPYTGARPVSLSGYYKYSPQPINEGSKPGTLTTDECNIYVKLWDASGNQIGFGEFVGTETVTSYTRFSFDITYTDMTAKPATITIVATSSHYGGDFSGSAVVGQVGNGSTLWIDEFELSYYK
ncbi:DUF4493 domain-containing protein [Bacteroides faecalis]|nr:DUF4493 domain-containing protein [Bacteroides faecalis]